MDVRKRQNIKKHLIEIKEEEVEINEEGCGGFGSSDDGFHRRSGGAFGEAMEATERATMETCTAHPSKIRKRMCNPCS